jgi:hypothetical protein
MCEGRLLGEVLLGDVERPCVPSCAEPSLTRMIDGCWGLWAHKVAFDLGGGSFQALTRTVYPSDAEAACSRDGAHRVPEVDCSCGFHAVGAINALWECGLMWHPDPRIVVLDVLLTGRVLVLGSDHFGVLFRAERQTVIAVNRGVDKAVRDGRAQWGVALPQGHPTVVAIDDDPGIHAPLEQPVSSWLEAVRLPQPMEWSFSDAQSRLTAPVNACSGGVL